MAGLEKALEAGLQEANEGKQTISSTRENFIEDCERAGNRTLKNSKSSSWKRRCRGLLIFLCGCASGYSIAQMMNPNANCWVLAPASMDSQDTTTSPPAADTPTLMPSRDTTPPPLTMVMDCPASDGEEYETFSGEVYRKQCGVDWPVGALAADGDGLVRDLLTVKTFTFDECIDTCSTFNRQGPATRCVGVSWGVTTAYLGNCWLKADVGVDQPRMVDQRASARLLVDE